jgi:hypothetical protein
MAAPMDRQRLLWILVAAKSSGFRNRWFTPVVTGGGQAAPRIC